MAAKTTTEQGIDWLLYVGSDDLGGEESGTLRQVLNTEPVTHKGSANIEATLPASQEWGMDFTARYVEAAALSGAALSATIGGTALKGVRQVSLSVQCDVEPTVNTTAGAWRDLMPTTRRVTVSIDADWYDPNGTGATALDAVQDEVAGSTSSGLAVVVGWGSGQSLTITGRPISVTTQTPRGARNTVAIEFQSTGSVTYTSTGADAGLAALITAILAANKATSVAVKMASANSGSSQWSGSGYVTNLSVSIPYRRPVEVTGTVEGSGALTYGTTT